MLPIKKPHQDLRRRTCVLKLVKIDASVRSLSRSHTHEQNNILIALSKSILLTITYNNNIYTLITCHSPNNSWIQNQRFKPWGDRFTRFIIWKSNCCKCPICNFNKFAVDYFLKQTWSSYYEFLRGAKK